MKKGILLLGLIIAVVRTGLSQDPQFSQYYQAPLYLNPGFTGITPQQRVVLNHRIQWPSLPQAFQTSAVSYDIMVNELRSGFGVLLTTDRMGSSGWVTTTAGLLYSYKVRLSEKIVFSPGLYFGYGTNGIDRSKLRLGDGLEYQSGGQYYSLDDAQNQIGRQSYFDVGSGFVLYNKNIWLGASFMHLNRPDISLLNQSSRLPTRTAIHGGLRLNLSGSGPGTPARPSYLTPSFIYRMQGKSFSQFDLGVNYHVDPVAIGLWYRGKPFETGILNGMDQDALILQLGLYLKYFSVGYSYDFTISELQTASGGAHEISVVLDFVSKPVSRKTRKKPGLIPCPSFNIKKGFWD